MHWLVSGTIFAIAAIWAWTADRKSGRRYDKRRADDFIYSNVEDRFHEAKARIRMPRF